MPYCCIEPPYTYLQSIPQMSLFTTCPTEPITYDDRVNIFTGTYHASPFTFVLMEIKWSAENPREASKALYGRMFKKVQKETPCHLVPGRINTTIHTLRKLPVGMWGVYNAHTPYDWVSPWGFNVNENGCGHLIINSMNGFWGRCEKPSPVLKLIDEVVKGNRVPEGKKRPYYTLGEIRDALDRHGVKVDLPKTAKRARVLATWKTWGE